MRITSTRSYAPSSAPRTRSSTSSARSCRAGWKLGSYLTSAPGLQRDLGPWSPWGRFLKMRRRFDAAIERLIAEGRADERLGERTDVLALLLQATYDDGSPMTNEQLKDQLLSILVAGHETTAASLAWTVERLRRHPRSSSGSVPRPRTADRRFARRRSARCSARGR